MRSLEQVHEDIEKDRAIREGEIRLIENIAARTDNEAEAGMLRRSLILLAYAHFEGFCKFALLAYASAINAIGLPCREACTPLVAATLSKVFAALRDVNNKHEAFAYGLPDDRDLHLLARHRSFIDNYETIIARRVELADSLVDTKSNLNSLVLKRNLYQLGLEYPVVDTHRSSIDRMLGVRNAIAHGDALKVPTADEVAEYTTAAFEVMQFVQLEVYNALRNEAYRRRLAPATA